MSQRLVLTDTIDKTEVVVEPGYDGILFVGHFVISKGDAHRLAEFLKSMTEFSEQDAMDFMDEHSELFESLAKKGD